MPTVTIPEALHAELAAKAAARNTTVDDLAAEMLAERVTPAGIPEEEIDTEYMAQCAADTSPIPTLEAVRAILSKLPGSLTADIIAGRDER